METTLKQRLILFIKYLNMSQSSFEKELGLSNGYINNISKGIGADKLQRILCGYPMLNSEWLIDGKGEMIKNNISITGNNSGSITGSVGGHNINMATLPDHGSQKIIKDEGIEITCESWPNERTRLLTRIAELEKEVESLMRERGVLEKNIERLDGYINNIFDINKNK